MKCMTLKNMSPLQRTCVYKGHVYGLHVLLSWYVQVILAPIHHILCVFVYVCGGLFFRENGYVVTENCSLRE